MNRKDLRKMLIEYVCRQAKVQFDEQQLSAVDEMLQIISKGLMHAPVHFKNQVYHYDYNSYCAVHMMIREKLNITPTFNQARTWNNQEDMQALVLLVGLCKHPDLYISSNHLAQFINCTVTDIWFYEHVIAIRYDFNSDYVKVYKEIEQGLNLSPKWTRELDYQFKGFKARIIPKA